MRPNSLRNEFKPYYTIPYLYETPKCRRYQIHYITAVFTSFSTLFLICNHSVTISSTHMRAIHQGKPAAMLPWVSQLPCCPGSASCHVLPGQPAAISSFFSKHKHDIRTSQNLSHTLPPSLVNISSTYITVLRHGWFLSCLVDNNQKTFANHSKLQFRTKKTSQQAVHTNRHSDCNTGQTYILSTVRSSDHRNIY